jgi:hypothetical protein
MGFESNLADTSGHIFELAHALPDQVKHFVHSLVVCINFAHHLLLRISFRSISRNIRAAAAAAAAATAAAAAAAAPSSTTAEAAATEAAATEAATGCTRATLLEIRTQPARSQTSHLRAGSCPVFAPPRPPSGIRLFASLSSLPGPLCNTEPCRICVEVLPPRICSAQPQPQQRE